MYYIMSSDYREEFDRNIKLVDKEEESTPLGAITIVYNEFIPKGVILLNDGSGKLTLLKWNGVEFYPVVSTDLRSGKLI